MLKIATIGAALALGLGGAFAQAPGPPAQADISQPALTNTNSLAVKKSTSSGSLARAVLRSATAPAKTEPAKTSKISLR
jgi:hypothetical protein